MQTGYHTPLEVIIIYIYIYDNIYHGLRALVVCTVLCVTCMCAVNCSWVCLCDLFF